MGPWRSSGPIRPWTGNGLWGGVVVGAGAPASSRPMATMSRPSAGCSSTPIPGWSAPSTSHSTPGLPTRLASVRSRARSPATARPGHPAAIRDQPDRGFGWPGLLYAVRFGDIHLASIRSLPERSHRGSPLGRYPDRLWRWRHDRRQRGQRPSVRRSRRRQSLWRRRSRTGCRAARGIDRLWQR